jgi:hypothetical protein
MTQQELIDLHRKLSAWHREKADSAALDMMHTYHDHLAALLGDEAERIARQHACEVNGN